MSDGSWFSILQGVSDCDKTPPVDNDVLSYDDSTLLWTPKQISALGYVPEAPNDGNQYARQSLAWSTINLSTYLKLDQTTPQTLTGGVPLMTTAVSPTGSGNQLVNKSYVDRLVPHFTYFV